MGALMFVEVLWDYISRYMLGSVVDQHVLFLSRSSVAIVTLAACVAIFYRYKLE
jgi:hypothetical protein